MKYATLPTLKNPVSRLVYGTFIAPIVDSGAGFEHLDAALAAGFTTFDSARAYGLSETVLGKWMEERGVRDDINLITKGCCYMHAPGPWLNPDLLHADLAESLKQLKTDHIDIYFLHKDDKVSDVGPIMETLNDYKAKGILNLFGTSNWTVERMEAAQEYAYKHNLEGFFGVQQCYSYLEQIEDPFRSVCLAGKKNKAERDWYVNNQMPMFAYSSLARGFLSGRVKSDTDEDTVRSMFDAGYCTEYYHPDNMRRLAKLEDFAAKKGVTVAQMALAYSLHSPLNLFAVVSPSANHAADTVAACDIELTPEEFAYLEAED